MASGLPDRKTILSLAAVILAGCGGHHAKVESASPLPGSIVEADGHKVYFDCEGEGSPTVVFLNGWGADSTSWATVFGEIQRSTRACEYDRWGVGLTASYGTLPQAVRDARDQERELDELLRNGGIPKPYVLVGHSWGGALARLYAGEHDDVKGVVLVDSSSPGQDTAIRAVLPPKQPHESELLTQLRQLDTLPGLEAPEHLGWHESMQEVGAATMLGDRPLVVITAGDTFAELTSRVYPVWLRLQNRLAALSSDSVHVLAPASGHFVQIDDSGLVLDGVRSVVTAVREGAPLGSCAAIFRGTNAECLR
jgi:pimeloyl-ACP methyl ester carboxylesterase